MSNKNIEWSPEAEKRLKRVPFFVRKLAKKKIEDAAQDEGVELITEELMDKIKKQEMG